MKSKDAKSLLDLKEKIETAKEEVSVLKGRRQEIEKRVKTEFGINIKDLEKVLKQMKEELDRMEEGIEKELEELKEKINAS